MCEGARVGQPTVATDRPTSGGNPSFAAKAALKYCQHFRPCSCSLAFAVVGPKQRHNRRQKEDTRHGPTPTPTRRTTDWRRADEREGTSEFPAAQFEARNGTALPLPKFARIRARVGMGTTRMTRYGRGREPSPSFLLAGAAPALLSLCPSVSGRTDADGRSMSLKGR